MSLSDLLNQLIYGDLARSVQIFVPEIVLCVTVVSLLLLRLFGLDQKVAPSTVVFLGALVAVFALSGQFLMTATTAGATTRMPGGIVNLLQSVFRMTPEGVGTQGAYFTGLLMHDAFTLMFRLGLAFFLLMVTVLTILTGIPDDEDGPDFYTLLVGSTIGMMIATGANNLLILFLGVEMMSVPSYAMVGFLKGRKSSSEAALKYVVYGAGTAGVMLYGLSLLAGLLGTLSFADLGPRLAFLLQGDMTMSNPNMVVALLGIMMVLVGLAFKLSLVPFHFWCPDAFEGASAEVGGYLSVASKAAAFALLVRFLLAITTGDESLGPLAMYLGLALGLIAMVSMTFGNLAAYGQSNVKRLLAYSTIAHAGYMLAAVASMLVIMNASPAQSGWGYQRIYVESTRSIEGLMYYLAVYLFMNLAAFAVVALVRNQTYSEEIDSYNGIATSGGTVWVLCVCMGVALFSLIGLPPFGGFFAKLMIFSSIMSAGSVHWFMWVVLAVAGLNTAFSLFYYVRVLKAMFINEAETDARPVSVPGLTTAFVIVVTIPILLLGMSPLQNLTATANFAASVLFQ